MSELLKTLTMDFDLKPKTIERFWRKVEKSNGCWIWKGGKTPTGTGQISVNNKHYLTPMNSKQFRQSIAESFLKKEK